MFLRPLEGADGGHRSVPMSVATFTRIRMYETSEVYVRFGGASTRVRLGRPWCRWLAAVDLSARLAFTLHAWLFSGYSCVLLGFASARQGTTRLNRLQPLTDP